MSSYKEKEEEGEVTIEDVVDCRIILVQRVSGNLKEDVCCSMMTDRAVLKETVVDADVLVDSKRDCITDNSIEFVDLRIEDADCNVPKLVHTSSKDSNKDRYDASHDEDDTGSIEDSVCKERNAMINGSTSTAIVSKTGDDCCNSGVAATSEEFQIDDCSGNDGEIDNGDESRSSPKESTNIESAADFIHGMTSNNDKDPSERVPCQQNTVCHQNDEPWRFDDFDLVQKSEPGDDAVCNHGDNHLKDELQENCDESISDKKIAPESNSDPHDHSETGPLEKTGQMEESPGHDGADTVSCDEESVKCADFASTNQSTIQFSKSEDLEKDREVPREEDYIEILDSSDSDDSSSEMGEFDPSVKNQNSGKEGISIVIDDASCDEKSCKIEHVSDCENDNKNYYDDNDDDDVEFIGVNVPRKTSLEERKRKPVDEEIRRTQEAEDNLERKIRQAREKRAIKVSAMNTTTTTSEPPTQFTMPNFTFYTGNAKTRCRQQNKAKKPRFNYMEDSAAFLEQERLLRESAARVKAQETIQRMMQMSCGGMQFYKEPVQDVSTLPKEHYKWSDPFCRLGVPQSARFDVVKKNYRKLCLLYHPDKARNNSKEAQDRFQAVKEAYETISASLGM
mmetsp:Transcript_9006/g.16979  ORF Transcript_9006/g.16979 Transcript_9006/m.16979 type:complete len:622 (-) Transcript_9006:104-1969(-)|eukprot:CAMPEP_0176489536 /NCGR_PEP_ID=MMETSP0200_2-20121128/7343_1 /TAXON_ID=947934 /ORGANISM="Chaetoceros sp., Strain GSL56" /LENGTH=621 /DNA_ID=CAMNT_0017886689 /DNA_START=162 /DNA_END=2027 /DNA_ORIENTATION=+